ncbi:MAG: hypothetical protein HY562_09235 [Ignavibacteriales bacterium]|nr:hypothetical protein [Ignavibacteriales bacterium]
MALSDRYKRPRAFDDGVYQWHLGRVPKKILHHGTLIPNPARSNAIFVVHGMGDQRWAETAATLRFGFEDALEKIHDSMKTHPREAEETPPPFIYEGYWADYDELKETFKKDWAKLDNGKRTFFDAVWPKRAVSVVRTFLWFARQQLRLLSPRVISELGWTAWLLYIPLQFVSFAVLGVLLFRYPRVLSRVLGDVRIYLAPKGIVERAIVQRIDRRVGEAFLKMLGLDWDFNKLPQKERIKVNGDRVVFERVIWVAHSLGTVVSYNVLSDLFSRASTLEENGTASQNANARKFRRALRRFVTVGSPLDKIAFLFPKDVLRPWPTARLGLLEGAETINLKKEQKLKEWWVNFFHVFDPVSGALDNEMIRGEQSPINYHIGLAKWPGLAHVAYWRDTKTLRFVLSRTYGKAFLPVEPEKPQSAFTLTLLSLFGYIGWFLILIALVVLIYYAVGFVFSGGLGDLLQYAAAALLGVHK